MIKGMEILKQTEILERCFSDFAKALLIIIVVAGIVAGICWSISEEDIGYFFATLLTTGLICILVIFVSALAAKPTSTGKYEYEVIFDDTVDMREVYARYEIIETRGDIYILRDIEPVAEKCNCHNLHTCKKAEKEDNSKVENNNLNTKEVEDNKVPNYCRNCGEAFDESDKFCAECGAKR